MHLDYHLYQNVDHLDQHYMPDVFEQVSLEHETVCSNENDVTWQRSPLFSRPIPSQTLLHKTHLIIHAARNSLHLEHVMVYLIQS